MEQLRRPLLSDSPLASIPETAENDNSSKNHNKDQGGRVRLHTSQSDNSGGRGGNQGSRQPARKERSTWGGSEKRPQRRKVKGLTEAGSCQQLGKMEDSSSPPSRMENYSSQPSLFHYTEEDDCHTPDHSRKDFEFTTSFSDQGNRERGFSEGGGVIDGRYSLDGGLDFVRVEAPFGDDGVSTAQELEKCKKMILTPYLTFLKVVGWRRWRGSRQDLTPPLCTRLLNFVYPSLIFLLMLVACVTQILTCFFRDGNPHTAINGTLREVECKEHIVTETIVPDTLLLAAYLRGLYLFRFSQPEHLSSLMEWVYLSFNFKHQRNPQKKLNITLRVCLGLAVVWVVVSAAGSILRVWSLQLLHQDTYLQFLTFHRISESNRHTMTEQVLRYVLVIYSIFGFILFDLVYVAVVLTYIANAQLLQTHIASVIDKVRTKAYSLGKAVKDMRMIYEFLKVLNGKLGTLTSLCLFIFIGAAISSVVGLAQVSGGEDDVTFRLGVSVGVVNFLQWFLLSLAPIAQAAHLTTHCRRLRRLGLEIASQPLPYTDTPQLLLNSFLEYTSSTRYTAKLAGMSIYPSYLIGFFFLAGILANWLIVTYDPFTFAPWF